MKRAVCLLLLAVVAASLIIGCAQASSEDDIEDHPLEIQLRWSTPDGKILRWMGKQLRFPFYEDSLWLYVPREAIERDVVLILRDKHRLYPAGLFLSDGTRLEEETPLSRFPHADAGKIPGELFTEVFAYAESGQPGDIYRVFISTTTMDPRDPNKATEVVLRATQNPTPRPSPVVSTFTNAFGTPTTRCAQLGCSNYICSSGDTAYCPYHSNKCHECKKYIDGDAWLCMDCIERILKNINKK